MLLLLLLLLFLLLLSSIILLTIAGKVYNYLDHNSSDEANNCFKDALKRKPVVKVVSNNFYSQVQSQVETEVC